MANEIAVAIFPQGILLYGVSLQVPPSTSGLRIISSKLPMVDSVSINMPIVRQQNCLRCCRWSAVGIQQALGLSEVFAPMYNPCGLIPQFESADTTDVTRWIANSRTRPDAGS